jgi:hypothetical protein
LFGKPRRGYEVKIKMYLQEIRWRNVDWIHSHIRISWQALLDTIMNLWGLLGIYGSVERVLASQAGLFPMGVTFGFLRGGGLPVVTKLLLARRSLNPSFEIWRSCKSDV